ncbi:MAG TPA: YgiQ family radical SAM protein, partial [Bacteroidales bacterium]|nr:YgiQ family radical SAM protein [Bacteroidales bacterium]
MMEYPITAWLPITRDEMLKRGWEEVDVVIISGDAYVDHPAFGSALIARVIEAAGYKVAIVPQPNWRDDLRDFRKFGKPRLCFAVSAGNMDSMVNHYTANKRLRSDDAYTPGGVAGFRPDYATVVYTQALKKLYPDVPVIIGGIEASMRRLVHYDYWSDTLKPSILIDSGADMLVYGMAEKGIVEVMQGLEKQKDIAWLTEIPQTAFVTDETAVNAMMQETPGLELPSFEQCIKNKKDFAGAFRIIETESNKVSAKRLVQRTGTKAVIVNPPYPTMTTAEVDAAYDLPYTRLPHPKYNKRGAIPAYEMIRHSVNIHRGCFGGCSFCALAMHQGKFIASRSERSVVGEVKAITQMPDFKGHITDLGAPSANMYRMQGFDLNICAKCSRPSCIFPKICNNLNISHKPLTNLYRKAAEVQGVKKVTIGSGVRYDLLVGRSKEDDKRFGLSDYVRQLVKYHISGRLKVAPEHTSDNVLKIMRKPSFILFNDFRKVFENINLAEGLKQQLIPYFISSHPGSRLTDMADLAVQTKEMGFQLEQVQDFTPTPMTLSSVIYWTGIHPFTGETIFTARSKEE